MKKILTLLLAAGSFTVVTAQSTFPNSQRGNDGRTIYANSDEADAYRQKEMQIQDIKRDFDQRIAAVKYNRRLRKQEKSRQIRMLENQCRDQIGQVQFRYDTNNHGRDYTRNYSHHR